MIKSTMNPTKFYINGDWQMAHSEYMIDVINPATEKVFTTITLGNTSDVNEAVAAAKAAFSSFSVTTPDERLAMLERILEGMNTRFNELANAMTTEMGAPYSFARNPQTTSGVEHLKIIIETLKNFSFSEQQGTSLVVSEPIGVCALITPWNWPINQIACKVFAALAAGCTMVLKPSEIAPLSALIFADIVHQAGLPDGVFNLVNGDGAGTARILCEHPDIAMVSITGSTRAGVAVAQSAAATVKRVHQELGGNAANIILADADLKKAVTQGVLSVFSNSGQSCDSPARMLIPAAKMNEAAAIAKAVAETVVVGDPTDPATTMGPLVSKEHVNKVRRLIGLAIDEGATLVTGGLDKPDNLEIDEAGYFCKPTVFADVSADFRIAKEEIFGPVVLMIPYDSEAQAIEIANDTEYGLAAYVQSKDSQKAHQIAKRLRAGTVQINYQEADMRAPFGGYKQSGNGREYGAYGLRDYLEYKTITGVR